MNTIMPGLGFKDNFDHRVCKNHLSAMWTRIDRGNIGPWFDKCSQGFRNDEPCEILVETTFDEKGNKTTKTMKDGKLVKDK